MSRIFVPAIRHAMRLNREPRDCGIPCVLAPSHAHSYNASRHPHHALIVRTCATVLCAYFCLPVPSLRSLQIGNRTQVSSSHSPSTCPCSWSTSDLSLMYRCTSWVPSVNFSCNQCPIAPGNSVRWAGRGQQPSCATHVELTNSLHSLLCRINPISCGASGCLPGLAAYCRNQTWSTWPVVCSCLCSKPDQPLLPGTVHLRTSPNDQCFVQFKWRSSLPLSLTHRDELVRSIATCLHPCSAVQPSHISTTAPPSHPRRVCTATADRAGRPWLHPAQWFTAASHPLHPLPMLRDRWPTLQMRPLLTPYYSDKNSHKV